MVNRLPVLLLLVLTSAFASLACADDFDYKVANIMLLQDKSVQSDMGIGEDVRAKLNKHAEEFTTAHNKLVQDTLEARKKNPKFKIDVAKDARYQIDFKRKIMAELTASQIVRLREVTLQVAGYGALTDKAVAKRIGISEIQRKGVATALAAYNKKAKGYATQARAIQQKAAAPVFKSFGGRKPKDEAEAKQWDAKVNAAIKKVQPQVRAMEAKTADAHKVFEAAVTKILTEEQMATLHGLMGAPVKEAA